MSLQAALELHAQGRAENARGRHAAAVSVLRAALDELDDGAGDERTAPARLRVQLTLSWALAELHGLDHGVAQLQEVYAAVDSGSLGESEALALRTSLHNQHALLLLRAGRTGEAYDQFTEAERWSAYAPVLTRCKVLLNRGVLAIDTLDLASARRDLARCAELCRQVREPVIEFKAMHNLGYVEFLGGDLPRALAAMDDAQAIDVDIHRGAYLVDRARVLMEAGLSRDAEEALDEAVRLLDHGDASTHDLAEARLEQARCRLQQLDWPATVASAAAARALFAARGNARREGTAALIGLMAQVGLGARDGSARDDALRLATTLDENGQAADARTATLLAARLMIADRDIAAARQLIGGLGPVRANDRIGLKMLHRLVRAEFGVAAGELAVAGREIRAGLGELAGYRARFGSIDAQTASAVHGVALGDLAISVAARGGRPAAIFAAVERVRSISGGMAAVRPPRDDDTAALLAELRKITVALQADEPDAAGGERLQQRRVELQRAIKSREWRSVGNAEQPRPSPVSAISAELDRVGAQLVTFFASGGSLHALPVNAPGRRPVRLAPLHEVYERALRVRADLDALAGRWLPAPIAVAARRSLAGSLAALDAALLRPLRLGDAPVVIVPTGVLGTVPWNMLPSLRGVPVTVAPSATSWCAGGVPRRELGPAARVVALAGPQLTRAEEEARTVAGHWPHGRALLGGAATGDELRAALRTAEVVHVAAHGRHDADNPLFSSVWLGDGHAFGYDLVADVAEGVHVVLSACEVGLATVRPGDEPLGLTRALLHYGAATVVSGVARIADDVAADVMTRHHRELAAGAAPAEALARASAGEDVAPFVCFGSGIW